MTYKFNQLFEDVTHLGVKIPKKDYLIEGKFPIIDQGKSFVAGYTNVEQGAYMDVPAIVFGDHTRIFKYVTVPFFLGADGIKLLQLKNKSMNCHYLYYALSAARIPDTGYNRHFKWLKNMSFDIPVGSEQQRVVGVLDSIETLIDKKHEMIYMMDQLIKSRFVEMFGEPGRHIKGFKLTTIGECCELNPKKPENINENLIVSFVPMADVSEDGKIECYQVRPYKDVKKGFTYFADNDVIFAKITPCMENGKGAVAQGLINGMAFGSTEFHVLRPQKEKTNPYWLYVLTSLNSFRVAARKRMTGTGGQLRVPVRFLDNYPIYLPPIELQNQFADFVHQVDKSKLAVKKSLEQLEILKKSLMQQYFG